MYFIFISSLFRIVLSDVVNTSTGPVRGVPSLAEDVEAFLGIPYAEAPIGELRFAKPVPKEWTQVLNASDMPPPCPQISAGEYYFMPDITNMTEDCLYLNIWAPRSKTDELRPVVIHIHQGFFAAGSSNMKVHDGSFFASRGDLVTASMNYRLGSLGYFYSGNEVVGGNMGMYDQIMAIKWLKENAKQFGGDPENIVLQGFSAGSLSITAHMLSPLSMNLFNRVILQSGSMLHPYFFDDNARLTKNSQAFASALGCSNKTTTLKSDPESVVKCLKGKPIEEMVATERSLWNTNPGLFLPRMNDEFLPKGVIDALLEGKFRKDVDVLIGVARDEGTLMVLGGLPDYVGTDGKALGQMMKKGLTHGVLRTAFSITGQRNSTAYIKKYMSLLEEPTSVGYIRVIANVLGDYIVGCGPLFFADFVSLKGNPVYFYRFDFRPASTPNAEWVGTTHLDDLHYVFGIPYHENFTAEEIELSRRMMNRWSSFARTGNPNIKHQVPWPRYNYHEPLYLSFGQEEESTRLNPNKRCQIWREEFKSEFDPELIELLQNSE